MFSKNQRLVILSGAWAMIVLTVLVLLQSLNLEYFFILCLIGFLILVELSGPFMSKPAWRNRVNVIIVLGVLMFAYIVYTKVSNVLG